MRTTGTLEPDVAERIKAYAHRRQTSFKQALDELLRRGLSAQEPRPERPPYRMEPFFARLAPGVDASRLNQLADELEAEDFLSETDR